MSVLKTTAPSLPVDQIQGRVGVPSHVYVLLIIAMTTGGFIAPLIRLTLDAGMPPIALVGTRLTLAWSIFTPFALGRYRDELFGMKRRQVALAVIAGVLLSFHFTLMSVALLHVSVMVGQVLVSTAPLWVAIMETVFLKTRFPRIVLVGLVLAVLGGVVIGFGSIEKIDDAAAPNDAGAVVMEMAVGDDEIEKQPIMGVILLFISAVGVSAYLTIGRSVRENVSLVPYVWVAYGSGALASVVMTGVSGTALAGYSAEAYLWVFLLMVVGQLLVHTNWNYVMGYLPATVTSLSGQMISVMAAVVAFFLFAEVPNRMELLGGAVIITGVMIAIWGQRETSKPASETGSARS
jgi:drug/metabolite transporter (DMT)-like permease